MRPERESNMDICQKKPRPNVFDRGSQPQTARHRGTQIRRMGQHLVDEVVETPRGGRNIFEFPIPGRGEFSGRWSMPLIWNMTSSRHRASAYSDRSRRHGGFSPEQTTSSQVIPNARWLIKESADVRLISRSNCDR